LYLQGFENLLTKIEKIAKTTTLAKERKVNLEKDADLVNIAKGTRIFHCNKKDTNPASIRVKRSVQGEALFICQKINNAGARFLKFPVTFRARNQVFKSKYKE